MAIKIRPYNLGSKSAKLLRNALSNLLGRKVWMSHNNNYLRRHRVINWGSSKELEAVRMANVPRRVRSAINKNLFLERLNPEWIPEFTFLRRVAEEWCRQGHKVYCRKLLSSSEGRGIVVATTPEELVDAPLYTKRFPHAREYRVHVAYGNVIQIVQKKKRKSAENANPMIRSNNDWVFARNLDQALDSEEVTKVKEVALKVVQALGLDFGACDVLYSKKQNKAIVLECNTAPGLDNTSANVYAQAFLQELR